MYFWEICDRKPTLHAGFSLYLTLSDVHNIIDKGYRGQVYQDMTNPLAHYWISSCHTR